ncbi:MAG: TetR/AcrR family transcriptional regulator [Tissierellia bacterium]|nr:TetR/AcrR family transcriptional regulator [Tissierellia bacterium]
MVVKIERNLQSENILKNAFKLFREKGYKNTTTREIAKASDINKGLLHYYYKQKEDLIFEMYSDMLNGIHSFIDQENKCKNDAFLYYAVFNIVFFRTISTKEYLIDLLGEIIKYKNLTKLKIEKSTEMLYSFLKGHGFTDKEYHLLLAVTVAVGAESELILSISDGKIKMTYDKLATTINKLLFTMLKINEKETKEINLKALRIADEIDISSIVDYLRTNISWLSD